MNKKDLLILVASILLSSCAKEADFFSLETKGEVKDQKKETQNIDNQLSSDNVSSSKPENNQSPSILDTTIPEVVETVAPTPTPTTTPTPTATPTPTPTPDSGSDRVFEAETFLQTVEKKKVDIVWVIDNSGSMSDDQTQLGEKFKFFINKFGDLDIDFKMAITNTDVEKNRGHFLNFPDKLSQESLFNQPDLFKIYFNGDEESLRNYKLYNSSSPDYIDFSKLRIGKDYAFILQGIHGSGYEKGLAAAMLSISSTHPNNTNFYFSSDRQEASTYFIIVSDEDDNSLAVDIGREWYGQLLSSWEKDSLLMRAQTFVEDMQSALIQVGRNPEKMKFFSIVNTDSVNRERGIRYEFVSQLSGGKSYEINRNFEDLLSDLSHDLITELVGKFSLQKQIEQELLGEVKVLVDEVEVSKNDWSVSSTLNAIEFKQNKLPQVGSKIKIIYPVKK